MGVQMEMQRRMQWEIVNEYARRRGTWVGSKEALLQWAEQRRANFRTV